MSIEAKGLQICNKHKECNIDCCARTAHIYTSQCEEERDCPYPDSKCEDVDIFTEGNA